MEDLENSFIRILDTNDIDLQNCIERLYFDEFAPSLVLGFISPHLNF